MLSKHHNLRLHLLRCSSHLILYLIIVMLSVS